MSFSVTSQSVIRFESGTHQEDDDEWRRTLMFFNVDISGGAVRCDHRNEITASRTRERNGKRRNPGGGLSNPIKASAMSFGVPNKFYAQSRDGFKHREPRVRRRSVGGRRNNSTHCDNRRQYHYRERWNNADIASCSHIPPVNSTDRYVSPDYEAYNGYDDGYNTQHYPEESYQNEAYEMPKQTSVDLNYPAEVQGSRDYYQTESYADPPTYECTQDHCTYERPTRGSKQGPYEPPAYRTYCPYYPEEIRCDDYKTNCKRSVSQLSIYRPGTAPRQASGSVPAEYALNYDDKNYYSNDHHKEYKKESSYERYYEPNNYEYEERYEDPQPPQPEREHKIQYSVSNNFNYEDYNERRHRPAPVTANKPKAKPRSGYGTPYKTYKERDYSISQSRKYTAQTDKYKDTDLKLRQTQQVYEPESPHRNSSSRRHYHPEKVPSRTYCNHFEKNREAAEQYDRVSKQILSLGSPRKYEHNVRDNERMPRRTSERNKLNFYEEPEIPQPYRKYIKKEVPRRSYKQTINDEARRRQISSITEPPQFYDTTVSPKKYDHHERRSYRRSSPEKKKSVDFGSEIPHRLRKSRPPSQIVYTIDIPYKRRERRKTYGQYVPGRSDSGCDTGAQHANPVGQPRREPAFEVSERPQSFQPQTSLYDVRNHQRSRKTIRQQISGFFKRSKMCLKRSSIFRGKPKKVKTCGLCQRGGRDNDAASERSNTIPPSKQKSSISDPAHPDPSMENANQKYLGMSRIGCHYPTVYRGKCEKVKEEYKQYSMYNLLRSVQHSKCDHSERSLRNPVSEYSRPSLDPREKSSDKICNRISSGNCSIYNDDTNSESMKQSQINVCLTIRGTDVSLADSPRITASKVTTSHGIPAKPISNLNPNSDVTEFDSESTTASVSRQVSGSTLCASCSFASKENQFKNVRFTPSPSISQSCSSTSNSSQSSRTLRVLSPRISQINRTSIGACSKPPEVSKNRSSEDGPTCPRRRISTKWSLTRQSCFRQSNQTSSNTWSPDKIESNCCRPQRPGLCLPNNIEMCSRPPTVIQCDLNKRSSLKGVNSCQERPTNKRVSLKTSSSSSCPSKMSSGNSSQNSDKCPCSSANREIDLLEDLKCHRSQCDLGQDQKTGMGPRRTCSWPPENPRSCPPRRTRSDCVPQVSNKCSGSTISKCSRSSSQRNSRHSPENMQLVCLPHPTLPTCSSGTHGFTNMPCRVCPDSIPREDLCCSKLITDWEKKSCCRRSIVEELKRELLQTFRTEQQIESRSHCLRPTPHIMIFPCVPEKICQPSPNMAANPFCRPESVVCWAACPRPPTPF